MLSGITLGQYFPGDSFIHQLDPRTKIVGTVLFISSIFLAETFLAYGMLVLFALLVVSVSGIPVRLVAKSVKPLWLILLITFLIHIVTTPGKVILAAGPIAITDVGLNQGIMMSVRLILLIVVSSLLTFTTSPIVLTDGIERLLNPLKRIGVPAHELAMMMTIALRFIPTLIEETERIMKAQVARGAEFSSGSILKRAQNMIPLLVPLFISAFRRADELATAMEARCYRGGENRTRMKALCLAARDGVAMAAIGVLIVVLIFIKWS